MDPASLIPYERTFDALYGLEIVEHSDGHVVGRVAVREALMQPAGLVHGGVYAAMAESLTSMATHAGVYEDGMVAQGLSNQTSYLRPILEGTITARATRRHKGRTTWVWEVDITDDEGRLCVISRVTVAVRPNPRSG